MKNNVHKQIIGVCWIVLGALIFSLLMLKLTSANSAVAAVGMVIGLVYLVAGFWLMANLRKSWWVCLPAAVLSLFTFPVGTLIGIYYLWYYFKHEQVR